MKLNTFVLAFALALVITGLCASSIVWAQNSPSPQGRATDSRTLRIQTHGDATARARVTLLVIKNVCAAQAITWDQQVPASTRITCPLAQPVREARRPRYTHLDFTYQTAADTRPAISGAAECHRDTWVSVAGKAVLLRQTCGGEPGGDPPFAPDGFPASLSTMNQGPSATPWKAMFQTAPLPETALRATDTGRQGSPPKRGF